MLETTRAEAIRKTIEHYQETFERPLWQCQRDREVQITVLWALSTAGVTIYAWMSVNGEQLPSLATIHEHQWTVFEKGQGIAYAVITALQMGSPSFVDEMPLQEQYGVVVGLLTQYVVDTKDWTLMPVNTKYYSYPLHNDVSMQVGAFTRLLQLAKEEEVSSSEEESEEFEMYSEKADGIKRENDLSKPPKDKESDSAVQE